MLQAILRKNKVHPLEIDSGDGAGKQLRWKNVFALEKSAKVKKSRNGMGFRSAMPCTG